MKRTIILSISVLMTIFLLLSVNFKLVTAQNNNYSIQNVDHQVQLLYSGNLVVRDTITLSGQTTTFLIGFPYKYGNYILNGFAMDQAGTLPINIGVQLGNQSGFYGIEVTFPQGTPQIFTVIIIFSNSLLVSGTSAGYGLDFPAYPSFTVEASHCNVNLILPSNASAIAITKPDGDINATSYVKDNLAAFTNAPATATFNVATGQLQQLNVNSYDRVITIYPAGNIGVSDTYHIANLAPQAMATLRLDLPSNASNVVGKDEFGRTLVANVLPANDSVTSVSFNLINSVGVGQSTTIILEYNLPLLFEQNARFAFILNLFPVINYYVDDASVQIIPPEGAHFVEPTLTSLPSSLSMNRVFFQENLKVEKTGVSYVDNIDPFMTNLRVAYAYSPLWLSFRPTLGVWTLAVVGSILIALWRRPKAPTSKRAAVPRLSAGLSPDNVRAFTEAYEERRNINRELRVLHARAQKGKIPRSYYKSQRKTLETRLDALTKSINQLKGTFRNAGGKYNDLIRQFDAAESELAKARNKVRAAETRHRTGEMSIDEYKKALTDYQQQKEKLDQQINGILLRLREEIR